MERAMETLVSRRWNLRIASVVRSMIYFGSFAEPGFLLPGLLWTSRVTCGDPLTLPATREAMATVLPAPAPQVHEETQGR